MDHLISLAKLEEIRTFGITIGTTILQNGLLRELPKDFLAQFPSGAEISYAIIPKINTLPEPLQSQVKAAFGVSISHIWYFVIGLGGLGLLLTLPMQALELHLVTDENWGFEERVEAEGTGDVEKGSGVETPASASADVRRSEEKGEEKVDEKVGESSDRVEPARV